MAPLGVHYILEMYTCPAARLNDAAAVVEALRSAAAAAGATILGQVHHRFQPQGVTALALLAESHIAIHTWPELGYAAADVFTCGEHTAPRAACASLVASLGAARHVLRTVDRGEDVGALGGRPALARGMAG